MRDLSVAISFANLCYLKVWWDLIAPKPDELFFYDAPAAWVHCVAIILNVLLLGFLLWMVKPGRAYFYLLPIPALAVRNCLARVTPIAHPGWWLQHYRDAFGAAGAMVLAGTIVALVWFSLRNIRKVSAGISWVLGAMFFVFPIFCLQSAWMVARQTPWGLSHAVHEGRTSTQRVVWIIFDEWDYTLSFVNRPKDLAMPEFDRLASESLVATHAFPPAGRTIVSIPALLAGKLVSHMQPTGPSDAKVTFEPGTPPVSILSLANGHLPDAIAGWWFPYSRIFGGSTECSDCETEGVPFLYGSTFGLVALNQMRSLVETEERSPFGQSLFIKQFRGCYEFVMKAAKEKVANRAYSSVFIHLPVPHDPFFYDRKTQKPDMSNPKLSNYFGQLSLADKNMGEIRKAMEDAGLWGSSTVIVSSDHWYRAKGLLGYVIDHRVPFLVKLAGQTKGVQFDEPFNTVLTKQLISDANNGAVTDTAIWLHQHRGNITESPYNGF